MIVAESMGRRLTRFTIGADGTLTDRATYFSTKPDGPDGICLDVDGAVWAAFPLAHEFRRFAPGGEVLDRIPMGERLAIACTLGGPEMRTLFLLTSLVLPGPDIHGTRTATIHVADVEVAGSRLTVTDAPRPPPSCSCATPTSDDIAAHFEDASFTYRELAAESLRRAALWDALPRPRAAAAHRRPARQHARVPLLARRGGDHPLRRSSASTRRTAARSSRS